MNWQCRLRQWFRFISIWYEPQANSVVITLRLNTPFVFGAAIAATFLTLIFKYGGVTLANALELLSDLWRGGCWWWVGTAVVFALIAALTGKGDVGDTAPEGTGFWSGVKARLPKGVRGTALLCLALMALLALVMWAASGETPADPTAQDARGTSTRPETRAGAGGEETPRIYREAQKGRRP